MLNGFGFRNDEFGKPIKSGVRRIPINPEMEALNIVEVTFPLAIETITTEDETVEGKTCQKVHRKPTLEINGISKKG